MKLEKKNKICLKRKFKKKKGKGKLEFVVY